MILVKYNYKYYIMLDLFTKACLSNDLLKVTELIENLNDAYKKNIITNHITTKCVEAGYVEIANLLISNELIKYDYIDNCTLLQAYISNPSRMDYVNIDFVFVFKELLKTDLHAYFRKDMRNENIRSKFLHNDLRIDNKWLEQELQNIIK